MLQVLSNLFHIFLDVAYKAMNFSDYGSVIGDTDNLTFVMSTASSSGSGNGGPNNDPNHNVYTKNGSMQDPFSFLEDEEDEVDGSMGLLVKPLRDPLISLDDLVCTFYTSLSMISMGTYCSFIW